MIDDGSELSWCPHHNGPDQDLWVFAQELLGKTSGQCRIQTVAQMQIFLTRNLQMKGRTCAGCGTTSSCVLSQSGGRGSAFCWTQDALLHGNKSTHHPCRNKQLTKNHSNWSWLSWLRIAQPLPVAFARQPKQNLGKPSNTSRRWDGLGSNFLPSKSPLGFLRFDPCCGMLKLLGS